VSIGARSDRRRERLEQARIDRLLGEAEWLRRATDIRAYVDAVKAVFVAKAVAISSERPSNAFNDANRWLDNIADELVRYHPEKRRQLMM
jgi:hypothetical protein